MNLPEACEKCWPFGGSWIETPTGLKRCDCARGQALAARGRPPKQREMTPAISSECATLCTEIMAAMEFFPSEAGARGAIAAELGSMCESEAQAKWLAMRMVRLYSRWPGVIELRRVYCNSHPPLDGQDAIGASEVFPDGIPSERPPDERPKQLAAGAGDTVAPEILQTVTSIALVKLMPPLRSKPVMREGETEYGALARTTQAPIVRKPPRSVTPQEIEAIKRQQAASAEKDETRKILEGETKQPEGETKEASG
jgi:hypothetical protein